MNPFRCSNCNKLLGMIDGKAEIKCPKCKAINRTEAPNDDNIKQKIIALAEAKYPIRLN